MGYLGVHSREVEDGEVVAWRERSLHVNSFS